MLFWLCLLAGAADLVTVQGTLPTGARLELRAPGAEELIVAETSPFKLQLAPDRYDISLIYPSGRRARGTAWLVAPGVELHAEPEETQRGYPPDFDLLADWRVVNELGQPVGDARVTLQAQPARGAAETLNVWAMIGDEEKELEGALTTTPDGRFPFRVRESRVAPNRIVAILVRVEAKGYQPLEMRLTPVLRFSPAGRLYPKYPEEDLELKLRRQP
jgi:hypothetical protein